MGTAEVVCMESPVQDIIIGNIPSACGVEIVYLQPLRQHRICCRDGAS